MFQLHNQLKADTLALGELPLCQVLLMNDSQFPWIILVPQRHQIREVYELTESDQLQLQRESLAVSKLLMKHFEGDKLNVATLGNLVPQLHVHHIVRYAGDVAWPKPVWGNAPATPYGLQQAPALVADLQALMFAQLDSFLRC